MAQANTLDTGFLTPGDPDRQASLAIGAVAVVDGAVPDYELLKRVLSERIQSIPRCTQVLRIHPFTGAQQWIDAPGFDLGHHVRRVAIPRPGDDAEFSRAIAHALGGLGFGGVEDVRQGKYIELELKETDRAKAKASVEAMCAKLLANTVIENYAIDLLD